MRQVEFQRYLDPDNILRAGFELDRGAVLKFAVQLECRFAEKWVPVVRYDTAHNFAHCDRLHPYEEASKTEMVTQDYNEALTVAMNDLTSHWRAYRRRYEEWLR